MARPTWKGSLQFGLVSIGVEIYTAVQEHLIGFKLLHSACNSPLSNKRWCQQCQEEVVWDDTVKGLKLKDGSYYVLTQSALKKLRPERSQAVEIIAFVERIPEVYHNTHYYLMPADERDKAYFLFVAALKKLKKVAIGRMVLRDKEYLAMIAPYEDGLLLTTLHYAYEVKPMQELKAPRITKKELELAQLLIDKLTEKEFPIESFRDTFSMQLLKAIKKGKTIPVPKKPEIPQKSLMEALKASLKEAK